MGCARRSREKDGFMTFTITLPLILLLAFSFVMFILATLLNWQQGLFEPASDYGFGGLFAAMIYAILWAIPSLLAWAIYATWGRT